MPSYVADVVKPMNGGAWPVAEAVDITVEVDAQHNTKRLQQMFEDGDLGAVQPPTASGKILKSDTVNNKLVWTEVDADNDELGNSAGYQTSSNVDATLQSALGTNYASGELTLSQIILSDSNHTTEITPAGMKIDNVRVATMTDVTGIQWTVTVVASKQDLPSPGVEHVLYLVPSGGASDDIYEEYIWVIVDPSTTPATYGYEKIGDTQLSMSASAITYTNVKQTGVTNVEGSLNKLVDDFEILNAAIDLTIKSYSVALTGGGSVDLQQEKGTNLAAGSLTFSWAVNKPLTALTFAGTSVSTSATSATNASDVTANTTFTLSATAGTSPNTQTASKSISFQFLDSVYWGPASLYVANESHTGDYDYDSVNDEYVPNENHTGDYDAVTYDSDFVVGLANHKLKANYVDTYSITIPSGKFNYGYIAFPSYMNAPTTPVIGALPTSQVLVGTITVTNGHNHSETYKLYRTQNPGLGSTKFIYT